MIYQNFLDFFTTHPASIEALIIFIIVIALLLVIPVAGSVISIILFVGILTVENFLVVSGDIGNDIHISLLMILLAVFTFLYLYLAIRLKGRIRFLLVIQAILYILPLILLLINSFKVYVGPPSENLIFQLIAGTIILAVLLIFPYIGAGISLASFFAFIYVLTNDTEEFVLNNIELYGLFLVILIICSIIYCIRYLPKKKIAVIQIACYCLTIFPLGYVLFNDYWISLIFFLLIVAIAIISLVYSKYPEQFKEVFSRLNIIKKKTKKSQTELKEKKLGSKGKVDDLEEAPPKLKESSSQLEAEKTGSNEKKEQPKEKKRKSKEKKSNSQQ